MVKKIFLVLFLTSFLCSCSINKLDENIETSLDSYHNTETSIIVNNPQNKPPYTSITINSHEQTVVNLVDPVSTIGTKITLDELTPIIEAANYNKYLIDGGDDIFTLSDGHYVNYNKKDFYAVIHSFNSVFSKESELSEQFLSSLICYKSEEDLLISRNELSNFVKVEEDLFDISPNYTNITITGGIGSNPTFLYNEFEIINRTETTLTIKNTAYYSEENDNPIQVFEYDMVFEDGTWKFLNFERWY